MRMPGPDHPISIAPQPARVVVRVAGRVVADSLAALELREASYAPVQYIPEGDVTMDLLQPSAHTTHCPYTGDAAYFSIAVDGAAVENAVWTYPSPFPAVAAIAGHLAFYPGKVDAIQVGSGEPG